MCLFLIGGVLVLSSVSFILLFLLSLAAFGGKQLIYGRYLSI